MAKTTPATPSTEGAVALKALLPIEHDGVRYEVGAPLEVPAAAAQPLIDCGAAEKAD